MRGAAEGEPSQMNPKRNPSGKAEPRLTALGIALMLLALLGAWPTASVAHEERLLVGRVETIDLARKLLVITRADAAARQRLEVTPETEVIACRSVTGLGAVRAGGLVRVKYLEKPGSPLQVQSILLLR